MEATIRSLKNHRRLEATHRRLEATRRQLEATPMTCDYYLELSDPSNLYQLYILNHKFPYFLPIFIYMLCSTGEHSSFGRMGSYSEYHC